MIPGGGALFVDKRRQSSIFRNTHDRLGCLCLIEIAESSGQASQAPRSNRGNTTTADIAIQVPITQTVFPLRKQQKPSQTYPSISHNWPSKHMQTPADPGLS